MCTYYVIFTLQESWWGHYINLVILIYIYIVISNRNTRKHIQYL